jgi:TPR repeat protein
MSEHNGAVKSSCAHFVTHDQTNAQQLALKGGYRFAFEKAVILFFLLCLPAFADLMAGLRAVEHGDYATAFRKVVPLAKRGDASAQALLGTMYYLGVPNKDRSKAYESHPDYEEAARWFRFAAKQGNVSAQVQLGELYRDGRGVSQNYEEVCLSTRCGPPLIMSFGPL